ncbi:tRNA-specific adenosine deaminase [Lepidopterella palustris CBS 459.81]|uniref:tRNA-specific adenosine deaminase n=1 Tax=Lepidopterella palustris CBS 459.81 TaxID=1314670 RepID=A0A8E2JBW0_9PEZI|nr:tRNA-specific adenosine deaminase [Lepidopterella palustris CBS 459.81]
MKCLPSSKIPLAHGTVLHDWHAEILAIRAFNRFLVQECADLAAAGMRSSTFIRRREDVEKTSAEYQPFAIQEDVKIHMYCSEAPCGDASMELVMEAQEDATPWPVSTSLGENSAENTHISVPVNLRGRSNFSLLGHVRLKPSRPDAPPTLSRSCTDKLALAQTTSLLSSLTSLLITPRSAYLSTLILPASQHVPAAITRAFSPSGRMSALTPSTVAKWEPQGYNFHPFKVETVDREFAYSRRCIHHQKPIPSNLSAVYFPHFQETLIGGVLQGRKQFDPRGASKLCRKSMWKAVADVAAFLAIPALVEATKGPRYEDVKAGDLLVGRREVEEVVKGKYGPLKGWVRNEGDGEFGLD